MYLGIDTSAYTTSIAIIDDNEIVLDKRVLLEVKKGKRGLKQSEAVFQHLLNLNNISTILNKKEIKAVGVSIKPTNQTNSYMPVFKVGESVANFSANLLGVPLVKITHQEGHIAAGIWSNKITSKKILTIHMSGGTTDVLDVLNEDYKLKIKCIGKSSDLHAGQFIDRVGVSLGSHFPAGSTMDLWAQNTDDKKIRIPSSVIGNDISFSGPESAAQRLIDKNHSRDEIANATFICIARSIEKVIRNIYQKNMYDIILLVGGVARNSIIKKELKSRLPYKLSFCKANYSSDNAVGVAVLTMKKYKNL